VKKRVGATLLRRKGKGGTRRGSRIRPSTIALISLTIASHEHGHSWGGGKEKRKGEKGKKRRRGSSGFGQKKKKEKEGLTFSPLLSQPLHERERTEKEKKERTFDLTKEEGGDLRSSVGFPLSSRHLLDQRKKERKKGGVGTGVPPALLGRGGVETEVRSFSYYSL